MKNKLKKVLEIVSSLRAPVQIWQMYPREWLFQDHKPYWEAESRKEEKLSNPYHCQLHPPNVFKALPSGSEHTLGNPPAV